MGRPRLSIAGLVVAVAVAGFDLAAMANAVRLGRLAHSVREYVVGFGLALLVFNAVVVALAFALARQRRGGRLSMTPSPPMILGFYLAVMMLAILSVLFFTKGRF